MRWFIADAFEPLDDLSRVSPKFGIRFLYRSFVYPVQYLFAYFSDFCLCWINKSAFGIGVKVGLMIFQCNNRFLFCGGFNPVIQSKVFCDVL